MSILSNPRPFESNELIGDIRLRESQSVGITDTIGAAFSSNNSVGVYLNSIDADDYTPDENFRLDEDTFGRLSEGINPEYTEDFGDAVSAEHAMAIREKLLKYQENAEILHNAGMTGTVASIAAGMLDPAVIGLSMLTGGVAAPWVLAGRAGRLGMAARGGLVTIAGTAPVEAYIAEESPEVTWKDAVFTTAFAGVLGAGITKFADAKMNRIEAKFQAQQRDIAESFELEKQADMGLTHTEKGAKRYSRPPGKNPVKTADDLEMPLLTEEYFPVTVESPLDKEFVAAKYADSPKSAFSKARFDMSNQILTSEVNSARSLGRTMLAEPVGTTSGVIETSVEEASGRMHRVNMLDFMRTKDKAYKQMGKELGTINAMKNRAEFNREVSKAIRRERGTYTDNPLINEVADKARDIFRSIGQRMKASGMRGAEELEADDLYLTRLYDDFSIRNKLAMYGEDGVESVFRQAIKQKNIDIPDEVVGMMSKGMLKTIMRTGDNIDLTIARLFEVENRAELRAMFKEVGMDAEEIIKALDEAVPLRPGQGGGALPSKTARTKQRVDLDETASVKVINRETGLEEDLSFEDLLVNDIDTILERYSRSMEGHIELANRGIKSKVDWEKRLNEIKAEAGGKDVTNELDILDISYKHITGQRMPDNVTPNQAAIMKMLRDFNYIRVGNQMGFAQLAEIGPTISEGGIANFMEAIPEFRKIMIRAKDGNLSDELADELESITGIGADRLLHNTLIREQHETMVGRNFGSKANTFNNMMEMGKKGTNYVSGMFLVNTMMQRITMRGLANRFAKYAFKGKSLTKRKLGNLGLTNKDIQDRVFAQIRKHADTKQGILTGRRLKRLNIDNWDDIEAQTAFANAMYKWTRQIIQENDLGNLTKFFTTSYGKTIFQFRSFVIGAWSKQLLRGINDNSMRTYAGWAGSMFFGSLAYAAQMKIRASGLQEHERRDFLEKAMSDEMIAKAAFQRAGFMSLIPAGMDTALGFVGQDPIFNTRASGLSNGIFGNPTLDLLDKTQKASAGVFGSVLNEGQDFTQKNAQDIMNILPYQNMLVIKSIQDDLIKQLPKE